MRATSAHRWGVVRRTSRSTNCRVGCPPPRGHSSRCGSLDCSHRREPCRQSPRSLRKRGMAPSLRASGGQWRGAWCETVLGMCARVGRRPGVRACWLLLRGHGMMRGRSGCRSPECRRARRVAQQAAVAAAARPHATHHQMPRTCRRRRRLRADRGACPGGVASVGALRRRRSGECCSGGSCSRG